MAASMTVFFGCSDDSDPPSGGNQPTENGYQALGSSNSDFSLIIQALDATGLDAQLKGSSDITFFAPNNSTLINAGITKFDDLTTDEWEAVLEYHMMAGAQAVADLPDDGYAPSMSAKGVNGGMLSFYFNGASVNGNSIVNSTATTNGIIHEISGVNELPNVYDHLAMNAKMTTYKNGVNRLQTEYKVGFEDDSKEWTLFCPNETSMKQHLTDVFNKSIAQIPPSDLRAMLNIHIVEGSALTASAVTEGSLTTKGGDIDITSGPTIATHSVEVADIICTNGVIHIIGGVIVQ